MMLILKISILIRKIIVKVVISGYFWTLHANREGYKNKNAIFKFQYWYLMTCDFGHEYLINLKLRQKI